MSCLVILTVFWVTQPTLGRFIFIRDIPLYITVLWFVGERKDAKSKKLL